MGLSIGQAAGALGFLTSLSSGLGSNGTSGGVGQYLAQAANSSAAAVTNPLATALAPLLNGQVQNAPLPPNVLAPDTINALFAAQSQGGPVANTDNASDIASLQSDVAAFSTAQAGDATAASSVDSSPLATSAASNFLDQLMQHQVHALGSFTGQSVSVSA